MNSIETGIVDRLLAVFEKAKDVHKVRIFISGSQVVKLTRRHRGQENERTTEFVLTTGRPNYAERVSIKKYGMKANCTVCASEMQIQVSYFPRRHAKP
jgi:hypothetical protein